ncbi:MAG: FAD-binding protein [Pilosibacter sp.]
MKKRPVIIGAGPAGMFAALALSENGCAPILLEQGDAVEERTKEQKISGRTGMRPWISDPTSSSERAEPEHSPTES